MQAAWKKFAKTLGEIIKNHRIALNKSIYKISAECFMTKTSWRRIEHGFYKDIRLSSLWKIADGLEILPEDLIKELRMELGEDFSFSEE